MGKEEIENFSLRVFIFFLKGNLYIHKSYRIFAIGFQTLSQKRITLKNQTI